MTDQLSQDRAQEAIRRFKQLQLGRVNFDSQWQEIAERVWPSYADLFTGPVANRSKGEKKNRELFDSTAALGLGKFGAILDSLLTPRNQTWHRLAVSNRDLAKNREVRLYFEEVNRLLFKFRYAPQANFAAQNQTHFQSLGAFGTGALFTDELVGAKGTRYKSVHLGEVYLRENHQGQIDAIDRHFPMTARQAVQKWGEACPERIRDVAKTSPETEFMFLHVVEPRTDRDPERLDAKGMPFLSMYVSLEGATILSEGGYTSFPYAVSRYMQFAGISAYGYSPAMSVLPSIKTLNEQKKTMLKQGHRMVDPVLLAADDGVVDGFSLKPGAVNYGAISADGRALVQTLQTGNYTVGKDMMEEERGPINDAFLVNLFQILIDTPQMTATEVLERTKEKGILLAPTVGRQQDEYLGPLIERELDVLSRAGLLPPMPEILVEAAGEYRVEYDSPLARTQRAEEATGIMRTMESVLNVVNVTQNPEPLDHFDWDQIVPELAEIQGVPARWMRDPRMVQQMRQGRAEQAQAQQDIQAAPAAAAMMKAQAVAEKKG